MLTKFETQTKRVKGLSFHPTRPWILASLHSGTIQLWDYRIRTLVDKFEEHDGPVRGVCFHPTQPLFVSGGDDYKIKVWNYKLRRCLFTLLGHLDYIRTVQFHNESPWILSASDDQTIRIWNWQSRSCISILTGHNHYVMCAQFHPKDNLVVSASLDQTVRVWDISGLKKKNYSPTGADDGLKLPQNDLFGNTDVVILHVLEGHERGVNWAAFHSEEPLIVSAADDRQVKFWRMSETKAYEVDTLRGHMSNVSCALFHPHKPLIISNSEDKTIRVWDITRRVSVKIFRQDHDKDRFWILSAHPDQNLFAAGHDSGLIVFKLEHERPAYCVYEDVVYYIKDRTLFSFNYKQNKSIASLNIRRKSGLDCGPRSLHYNPAENAILVLTDQTYDLYQLPKDGNKKDQGEAKKGQNLACFVARNRFAVLSTSAYKILVKSLDNQTTKEIPLPKDENGNPYAFDRIWPASTGTVLLRDYPKSIVLFDLQLKKITNRINVSNIKFVVWSSNDKDAKLALIGRDVLVIANRQLEQLCIVHDTKMKSGAWHPNGVFIYTTLTHIKYCLPNGDTGIIRTLDVPIFIYAIAMNKVYCLDRKCRNRSLAIDGSEFMLKLAVVTGDFQQILSLVKKFGLLGQSIISYLQKKGFPELALQFVKDERTRFNLAMDCGNIEIALESAKLIDDKNCWHKLGTEALRQGNHQIVEMAYQRTKNFQRISFLYLITGNQEKLNRMMKIAEKRGDTMGRFHSALFLGDVQERVKILQQAGQIGLAYTTAVTHGLKEEAEALAEKLQESLGRLPAPINDPKLFTPPVPVAHSSETNWPLLTVQKSLIHKMLQNESKVGATLEMPGEEEIGDAWGTEADIDFDGTGGSSEVKEEGDNVELGEGEGWDVGELEGLESIAPVPIKSSSAGLYVPPRPNPSAQENWCSNSLLAVDHIAAGSVESAMKLLNAQAGIVNFEPLKSYFLSVFTGSSVALPTISSISSLNLGLEREPGFPVVPISLKALVAELQSAYKSTTGGKFTESLAHFRTILHSLLFFAAAKKDEETEARELLVLAREYVVGLEIELKRKELGESNPVRTCELAAYFTHTNLQPIHLVLSLRSAMNLAYKIQNFKLSASFAKRLLELNPQQQIATQARKLVAYAEQNNTNKLEINYDERNPFVICSSSFTPIYKGSSSVQCSYCGSSYQPQFKGKLCNICGVSEIGKDVSGLIFSQPKKGRR